MLSDDTHLGSALSEYGYAVTTLLETATTAAEAIPQTKPSPSGEIVVMSYLIDTMANAIGEPHSQDQLFISRLQRVATDPELVAIATVMVQQRDRQDGRTRTWGQEKIKQVTPSDVEVPHTLPVVVSNPSNRRR